MPHRPVPRAVKRARGSEPAPYLKSMIALDAPAAHPMLDSNIVVGPWEQKYNQRTNEVPGMSPAEIEEVNNQIDRRYEEAERQTDDMAIKMERLERMYRAEWMDSEHYDEEHIYLAKGREALQVVSAFLYGMVLQLPKLVEFRPTPSRLVQVREMWRQAKLAEALVNYYFEDIWKFRHTTLRDFIKIFLKFPSAIMRVDYHETDEKPDLRFVNVDRALQYIDPQAHRMKEAKWWIEKDFWSRAAVEEMFKRRHWHRPYDMPDMIPTLMSSGTDDAVLRRFFGSNYNSNIPLQADDMAEVWHYRQARGDGLQDRHAVRVGGSGGWLVRYGANPFPGPAIPYCGDSFDRHEWQIDGHGLLEMHEALQEVINTVLNLRLDDLRAGQWSPAMVPSKLITDQTIEDIENRQKLVRGNDEVIEWMMANRMKLQDFFAKLPMNDKETTHLYQDLSFLLGQANSLGHSGDTFRGQMPAKVTTAQEIQESLTNNQGVFRPAFMSLMQTVEDGAQIASAYLRDKDFFGEERIVLATGGRYRDAVRDWDIDEDGVRAARVRFDDMSVDVTISAVNGADAMLSRTFKAAVLKDMLASIGQIEGLYPDLRDRFDFLPVVLELFRSTIDDIDLVERSPEEAAKSAQAREEGQQRQIAKQVQLDALHSRSKEEARGEREAKSIQTRASADAAKEATRMSQELQNTLRAIVAEANAEERKEVRLLLQEHLHEMQRMQLEQKLEIDALKRGAEIGVGKGQGDVKTS